jgi:hypothetical protein
VTCHLVATPPQLPHRRATVVQSEDHAALFHLASSSGDERNSGTRSDHPEDHVQMIGLVG